MRERRSYPRIRVSGSVLYSKDVYPSLTLGSTLDLSVGGTKIESLYGLRGGDRLNLTIGIDPQTIKCRGTVIYVIQPDGGKIQAGIKLEELSEQDRLDLKQYLTHVIEQQG
jgi:hypothetical protein